MSKPDDESALFRKIVENLERLATRLYGATKEAELNHVYDEIINVLQRAVEDDRTSAEDIIMSAFRANFAVARVSLLRNIKLTGRITKLEARVRILESRKVSQKSLLRPK